METVNKAIERLSKEGFLSEAKNSKCSICLGMDGDG